jgi:predicted acetyltransferase
MFEAMIDQLLNENTLFFINLNLTVYFEIEIQFELNTFFLTKKYISNGLTNGVIN